MFSHFPAVSQCVIGILWFVRSKKGDSPQSEDILESSWSMKVVCLCLTSLCSSWFQTSRDRVSSLIHPPVKLTTEYLHSHQADLVLGQTSLQGQGWWRCVSPSTPAWHVAVSHLDFKKQSSGGWKSEIRLPTWLGSLPSLQRAMSSCIRIRHRTTS